jgi:hypothetical protein
MSNPACSYSNLQNYNGYGQSTSPPVPAAAAVRGSYIVPAYGTIGYGTLTNENRGVQPSCSGYFGIGAAYGEDAAQCNQQYSQSSCQ